MTTTETAPRGPEAGRACRDKTGTYAGVQRHYYWGEKPCEACREAERLRSMQRRRGAAKNKQQPAAFDLDAARRALDKYLDARRARRAARPTGSMRGAACGDKAGTSAGYSRHRAKGEPACQPCRYIKALQTRQRRQAQSTGIVCDAPAPCSSDGYTWHQEQGETPCPECTRYHQKENQK